MCPDELRVQGQYLFQLDDSQILAVLIAIDQCLIVFLDGLVNGIQAGRIGLQNIDLIVRDIFLRPHIFADDPFAQCRNDLSGLKIHQSQQISGFDIVLIKFQALP